MVFPEKQPQPQENILPKQSRLTREPEGLIQTRPSFTACLVAIARREEDPWGYRLSEALPGYLQAFSLQLDGFALTQGFFLDESLSLEEKHAVLMARIASPFYNEFYAGRIYAVDQWISQWRQQNQLLGKKSAILLPGAGFDAKGLRYRLAQDIYIAEFDTHETLALKNKALAACPEIYFPVGQGIGHFPVNYTDPLDSKKQLETALSTIKKYFGNVPAEATSFFVSLEGLSYYLSATDNQKLFEELLSILPVGTQCFIDWYQAAAWDPITHPYGQFLYFLGEPIRFTSDDYPQQILSPLEIHGKRWVERERLNRAQVAAERLYKRTGRFNPLIAEDRFGQITRFSRLEIVEAH